VLLGKDIRSLRETIVRHSTGGAFAILQAKWRLLFCPGSGNLNKLRQDELRGLPVIQLYDLQADVDEQPNVQDKHPEIVKQLSQRLQSVVEQGRPTPGGKQPNHGKIDIWRVGRRDASSQE